MKNTILTPQLLEINRQATAPTGFVASSEQQYHEEVRDVAHNIATLSGRSIVMLSGPSAAGKTTTAHMLEKYIEDVGVATTTISLDNFYLGRDKAPLLPDGRPDYETVDALNVPLLQKCLIGLIHDGYCEMPEFDFVVGAPKKELVPVRLEEGGVAIFEGIHALNPVIVDQLPAESLCRVFISIGTDIYDGDRQLLTSRHLRLIRRMIRDDNFRNSSPSNTLHMWTNVVMGEDKYLFPFTNQADYRIHSFHPYELGLFRDRALALFERVVPQDENYDMVEQIRKVLKSVEPVSSELVPENSLMREFIG